MLKIMYATRLQRLCDQYGQPSPNCKKVSTTRQPPAVNAGPSGLYDNYQRRKDQELMEEAVFMNTGLLPTTVTKISTKYNHRDPKTIPTSMSKSSTTIDLTRKTIVDKRGEFTRSQTIANSQLLTRSLPYDSQSSLKLSTRSPIQIPHKELDKIASSRAEEIEIDAIKAEQRYSARVTRTALSHRSRLDALL